MSCRVRSDSLSSVLSDDSLEEVKVSEKMTLKVLGIAALVAGVALGAYFGIHLLPQRFLEGEIAGILFSGVVVTGCAIKAFWPDKFKEWFTSPSEVIQEPLPFLSLPKRWKVSF